MGLALFTEASGTVSMGRRRRVLSRLGLRSPGKKVNSESLCATGNQPEKKRERERKDTETRALVKWDLQLYFQKELLYPELHISRSERRKVMQSQLNITSVWPSSGLGCFLHTFSFTRVFVLCGRRQWHPTPVLLPEKSHGWRSLVGYSPWGR